MLLLYMAYGAGVNSWRGCSAAKLASPLHFTSVASQRWAPVNTAPKSSPTVNSPAVITTLGRAMVLLTCDPPATASYRPKFMAQAPLTAWPFFTRRP